MGMFDSLYASPGPARDDSEWQTKAYRCLLDRYLIGDRMPLVEPYDLTDYQVEVLGSTKDEEFANRFATIRDGRLVAAGVHRDPSLPRLDYFGHLIRDDAEATTRSTT